VRCTHASGSVGGRSAASLRTVHGRETRPQCSNLRVAPWMSRCSAGPSRTASDGP